MNDLTIMGIKPLTSQIGEQFYPKTTTDAVFQPDSETGHATETTLTQILGAKADKVNNATNGNLAGLDSNGNLTDSGFSSVDISLQSSTPKIYFCQDIKQLTSEQVDALKLGDIVIVEEDSYYGASYYSYYVTFKDEYECNIDTPFNGENRQVTYSLNNSLWEYAGTEVLNLSDYLSKINSPIAGDFVAVSSIGTVYDSGKKASDFATAAQGALADTAYQKPPTGIPASDLAPGTIPIPDVFWALYNVSTLNDLNMFYNQGKLVVMVDDNDNLYMPLYISSTVAYFYFADATQGIKTITVNANNQYISNSLSNIETANNKVSTLTGYETDTTTYPNTKAVADALANYVQKSQTTGLLKNDGTVDTNTYLTQQDIVNKADKTSVVALAGTSVSQELADNTIYQCSELSSLTITIPSVITSDYISQINFESGSTATTLTAPNTIIWFGDDLINNVFVPAIGKQYVVIFYYDGTNVRSIVQSE